MKQPKKLTRTQKEFLSKKKLNAKEYMLLEETDDTYLFIQKKTQETIELDK